MLDRSVHTTAAASGYAAWFQADTVAGLGRLSLGSAVDQRHQRFPRHNLLHLGQEYLAPCALASALLFGVATGQLHGAVNLSNRGLQSDSFGGVVQTFLRCAGTTTRDFFRSKGQ